MYRALAFLALVLIGTTCAFAGDAFGTGFTYQGQLRDEGLPVSGDVDMIFRLYNAAIGGSQEGPTLTFDNNPSPRVPVEQGLFRVTLDFGVDTFNGTERWLEIQVRTPPGVGNYETLAPLQRISPTPYALQTRGFFVDEFGQVGVGTTAPLGRFQIATGSDAEPNGGGYLVLGVTTSTNLALDNNEIMARNNGAAAVLALNADGGNVNLIQNGAGFVGIGTQAPTNTLHVRKGTAGNVTAHVNSPIVVENNTSAYISILTPDASERGILFGEPSSNVAGGIIYNNSVTPDGFQFRANGNTTRMVIDDTGFVGIGTTAPGTKLHVTGGMDAEPASGGYITAGSITSANVTMDDNEIMARSNGAISTLSLNFDGGSILLGGDGTDGFVGIGNTSPAVKLHIRGGSDAGLANGTGFLVLGDQAAENLVFDNNEIMARNNAAASTLFLNNDGGDIRLGSVNDNGDVGVGRTATANDLEVEGTASKTTSGTWAANSDARIKTDIQTIAGGLAALDRVRLVEFRYTDEYCAKHPSIEDRFYLNVIAQEFREVFPDYVSGSGEYLSTGEEILQVDPYPLTIYSAAAVQELHALVSDQQAEIATLKKQVEELESMKREQAATKSQLSAVIDRLGQLEVRLASQTSPSEGPAMASAR